MDFDIQRWINFDEFVTPTIISIVYILGVILITLVALFVLVGGSLFGSTMDYGAWNILVSFILAILIFVFGNVLWRVYCEILMVIFKMNNHLNSIDQYFIAMKKNF